MNFKQQYQTEMQHISPSEEQCERIRAKVYEEIQKPHSAQPARKRKIPLKAIAITGASAACLVLAATFALRFTLPSMMDGSTAVNGSPKELYQEPARNNESSEEEANGASAYSPTTAQDCAAAESKSYSKPSDEGNKVAEFVADSMETALKIVFSEDMTKCEIYKGGEYREYALLSDAPLIAENKLQLEEIQAVGGSLDETLFIYSEDNMIWVYDEDKEFIGTFAEVS